MMFSERIQQGSGKRTGRNRVLPLKDHQGSLMATVCGNTVERLSYDAWGRRRNQIPAHIFRS